MRQQIKVIAPAVVSALLVLILPSGSAGAVDDCVAAPNAEAPPGSRWYYRTDRATKRKCWHLGTEGQKVHGGSPPVGARDSPSETVGINEAERQTNAPSTQGSTGEALSRRECDTELNVLHYRKIVAAAFSDADSKGDDIDVRMVELAAKGCRDPSADRPGERACKSAARKWSLTDHLGEEEIKSRLKSAGCAS